MLNITLPETTKTIIEKYLTIIDGKPCPYFKNTNNRFNIFRNKALIGKGTPEEIMKVLKQNEKAGIDCSGLVCHILNSFCPIKNIIINPSKNLILKLRFFIRPIENINVKILIDPINSIPVNDVSNIKKWDLIYIGNDHVLLIYRINNKVIDYIQASEIRKKVVKGSIKITQPDKKLAYQKWSDLIYKSRFLKASKSGVKRLIRLV